MRLKTRASWVFNINSNNCSENLAIFLDNKLISIKLVVKPKQPHRLVFCLVIDNVILSDPGGIRTHDPQLRRLLLYPTELPDLPRFFKAQN